MLAVLAAVLILVALGSSANPGRLYDVVTRTPRPIDLKTGAINRPAPSASAMSMPPVGQGIRPAPSWLIDLVKLLAVAVGLALVITFLRLLAQNLQGQGTRRAEGSRVDPVVIPEITEEEVVESFADTLEHLRSGGDVDGAILECWRRLSEIAENSGVRRRASQTAEEFTVTIMDSTPADRADLSELAGLYREAMFSTHVAGDEQRARAVACLERLHAAMVGER